MSNTRHARKHLLNYCHLEGKSKQRQTKPTFDYGNKDTTYTNTIWGSMDLMDGGLEAIWIERKRGADSLKDKTPT